MQPAGQSITGWLCDVVTPYHFPTLFALTLCTCMPALLYHADWRSGRCLCRGVITVMLKVRLHNSRILLRGLAIQSPPTACNRFPTVAIPTVAVPATRKQGCGV